MIDPEFLMCKMVDPSTSRAARVACTSTIETKYEKKLGDIQKRDYEEQGE